MDPAPLNTVHLGWSRMVLADAQLTANDVLHAYLHDEPLLFLGAAFITIALLTAGYCLVRRRFDPMLVCLAILAYLYGQRLRLDSEILGITHIHNEFFIRLRTSINYLVPIPAFGFFEAAGFLGRWGKVVVICLSIVFLILIVGTILFGPHPIFQYINDGLILVSVPAVALRSHLLRNRDPDHAALRIGLLCFVVTSVIDNIGDALWRGPRIEPYGFAVFLLSLGYVSAHRLLRRDHELGEMRSELELARRIQLSILPGEFPASAHFRVAARYVPMSSVAGDFYDFVDVLPESAGILIADVSGHGVPAALIASMVKMAATSQRPNAADPARLLDGMNAALLGNTQSQFVTAAYVHLDAGRGEFRYSAAGHPPMLLLRDGSVTEIIENGLLLAVTAQASFANATHSLLPGDRLLLYTDGILEARDTQGAFFGEEQLHAALRKTAGSSPKEAADHIVESAQTWARQQDDDLTVLVCDVLQPGYLGASTAPSPVSVLLNTP